MKYHVVWRPEATNQLIALWIRSVNKDAITGYVAANERILIRNPLDQGESRNVGTRLAFFRPLVLRYHVDESLRVVTILSLGWCGR